MPEPDDRLAEIAAELRNGNRPEDATVRELLEWFGAQRRGYWIVERIRRALDEYDLVTRPDFEGAYIDELLSFEREAPTEATEDETAPPPQASLPDPTYRIGKLPAANRKPTCVQPDDGVDKAITLMLLNDFSQLPVMTTEREFKGIIGWTSLGSRLALNKACSRVGDCMDAHREISLLICTES
jgi:CBS domain-containing protein